MSETSECRQCKWNVCNWVHLKLHISSLISFLQRFSAFQVVLKLYTCSYELMLICLSVSYNMSSVKLCVVNEYPHLEAHSQDTILCWVFFLFFFFTVRLKLKISSQLFDFLQTFQTLKIAALNVWCRDATTELHSRTHELGFSRISNGRTPLIMNIICT